MHIYVLFIVLLIVCGNVSAQLHCLTTERTDSTITSCLHASRNLSTRVSWDKARREGKAEAFDNSGKRIFSYNLRRFAGHASVDFRYHSNGQISRAEYRSAPDGGIQFYHIIHEFDEKGNQTGFTDLSQPDGRPRLTVPVHVYDPEKLTRPMVMPDEVVPETIACATPLGSAFVIVNNTRRSITIDLHALNYQWYAFQTQCCITLKPRQELKVYAVTLAERYVAPEEAFEIKIRERPRVRHKLIRAMPQQEQNQRIYKWHFVRE